MRGLLDHIKNLLVYDADKEFYARLFPDSVPRIDLMRLRKMNETDLPDVMVIERQNYTFPWEEAIFTDCFKAGYSCWVCEEDDRVIGYCLMSIAAGEAMYSTFPWRLLCKNKGLAGKCSNICYLWPKAAPKPCFGSAPIQSTGIGSVSKNWF